MLFRSNHNCFQDAAHLPTPDTERTYRHEGLEIQVCAMHNLINGGGSVLADGGYEHGSLEVNGYDVLVRYCDIGDDPAEPDDILHIDDWSFTYGEDAAFFANYLCNLYTPDYTPEWI